MRLPQRGKVGENRVFTARALALLEKKRPEASAGASEARQAR